MLQALIHGKLGRWLSRPPWEIEDLLTSVVFGSCQYADIDGWRLVLAPFLGSAVDAFRTERLSASLPTNVIHVTYEFWPNLLRYDSFDHSEVDGNEEIRKPKESESIEVRRAEPDLILTLKTPEDRKYLVFVEIKLNSGKSVGVSENKREISDQLAKYVLQLVHQGELRHATPLAVVYVTPGVDLPEAELAESRKEMTKLKIPAPTIYWVSWGSFARTVKNANPGKLPEIIEDMLILLTEQWEYSYEELRKWSSIQKPVIPSLPGPRFVVEWPSRPMLPFGNAARFTWQKPISPPVNWQSDVRC